MTDSAVALTVASAVSDSVPYANGIRVLPGSHSGDVASNGGFLCRPPALQRVSHRKSWRRPMVVLCARLLR